MENTEVNTTEVVEGTDDVQSLKAQLAEFESKNKELWDKIYKLKKENKNKEETPNAWLTAEEFTKMSEEREFFNSNPELLSYKDDYNKFTSMGYSQEEASDFIRAKDRTIQNREKTKSMSMSGTPEAWNLGYTKKDLETMGQAEYNKARAEIESWAAKLIS